MKNKILLLSLVLSAPVLADYKITFQNPSLQLKPFESSVPEDWEPPVGVMSLNPNGTVHCLDVPSNASVADRTLGGTVYEVVRTKAVAKAYAATACTSNMTDMSFMSFGTAFNDNISHWDVSNVTSMRYMFYEVSAFDEPIGDWDVGNVTNMSYMFRDSAFNQPIKNWDVSNVTNMNGMFYQAPAFNQPIENWDVGNVTNMSYMFYLASAFNQDIGSWDVSNVTNMDSMFRVSVFNQDIGSWDVGNVTNMNSMFRNASAFNQNISGWCVSNIASKPTYFDEDASSSWITAKKPIWGACP